MILQVHFIVSRGAIIAKKNRKIEPNYRNQYTFQIYLYVQFLRYVSLTDFIHSLPSSFLPESLALSMYSLQRNFLARGSLGGIAIEQPR